jgi:hypothetical protein
MLPSYEGECSCFCRTEGLGDGDIKIATTRYPLSKFQSAVSFFLFNQDANFDTGTSSVTFVALLHLSLNSGSPAAQVKKVRKGS